MVTPATGLPKVPPVVVPNAKVASASVSAPAQKMPVSEAIPEPVMEERLAPPVHSMPTYEVTDDNPAWIVLEKEIQNEIRRFTEGDIVVRMITDTKAAVYIEDADVPAAIGKAGKNIAAVVSKVGIGIDVRPLSDLPGREVLTNDVPAPVNGSAGLKIRSEKKQLSIICPDHAGKIVDLFSGKEYLFTATVDDSGEIHLARNSSIAMEMLRRYGASEELKIRPVD